MFFPARKLSVAVLTNLQGAGAGGVGRGASRGFFK